VQKIGSCREPIGRYGEQNSIARYRGYSACPIPTAYGKLMLADLIIQIPKMTFPINQTKPNWAMWIP
jgi:sulfide:quinone oxidoreductase